MNEKRNTRKENNGTLWSYYPLASEVAKGYSNATVRPSVRPSFHPSFRPSVLLSFRPSVLPSICPSFRNILVNTLGSTSFNGF